MFCFNSESAEFQNGGRGFKISYGKLNSSDKVNFINLERSNQSVYFILISFFDIYSPGQMETPSSGGQVSPGRASGQQ